MNNNTKAAVIGGVVAGVLTGLPIVGGCCFLWALAGGFLAFFMYSKSVPGPTEMADAAKLGATAGVIGAVISIIIGLPFFLLGVGMSAMNSDMPNAGVATGIAAAGGVLGFVLKAVFTVVFCVLGAVIGAAILGKKGGAGAPPPPPPPGGGYGGPGAPGGGYGGGGTPGGGGGGGGYGQGM
jgi:hypothetical protein